jgi:hypothetical protein
MNCCNANGKCDQGKDCPIRKQRIKEVNDDYVNGYNDAHLGDLVDGLADTFKALIAFIAVTAALTLLAFFIWGK